MQEIMNTPKYCARNIICKPIPVVARSEARVCGRSLPGTAGSNRARLHGCLSLFTLSGKQASSNVTKYGLVWNRQSHTSPYLVTFGNVCARGCNYSFMYS